MTPHEIISNKEVEDIFVNADFGATTKRDILNIGVLKCASGFYQGSTAEAMMREHGLIDKNYVLTVKGKAYLWAVYSGRSPM